MIKEADLLFESQLPSALYAQLKGWKISVNKLQIMYKDEKFKKIFNEVMKSSGLNFPQIEEDIKKLCNSVEKLSLAYGNSLGKRFRFKNPTHDIIIKPKEVEIGDDYNKELESIKDYLVKVNEYVDKRMKDISLNWKDEKGKAFEERMANITETLNKLSNCCSKIQKQIQNQSR